jgi:hypothetical protein
MLNVKFDLQAAADVAARLESVSGERVLLKAREVVNAVAVDLRARAIEGASQRINLTPEYLGEKTRVEPAPPGGAQARAEIIARGDLTILGHYGPVQLRTPGKRPGPGKPAGVQIAVSRGRLQTQPSWFVMRLRNSGKTGVFVREAGGRKKHLYGPSPYALVRRQAQYRQEEFTDALADAAVAGLGGLINESI